MMDSRENDPDPDSWIKDIFVGVFVVVPTLSVVAVLFWEAVLTWIGG